MSLMSVALEYKPKGWIAFVDGKEVGRGKDLHKLAATIIEPEGKLIFKRDYEKIDSTRCGNDGNRSCL